MKVKLEKQEYDKLFELWKAVAVARGQEKPAHEIQSLFSKYKDMFKKICKKYKLNPHLVDVSIMDGEIRDKRNGEKEIAL